MCWTATWTCSSRRFCGRRRRKTTRSRRRRNPAVRNRSNRDVTATLTIDLPSLFATETLGRRLAGHLFPGAVVALIGPLGAGKTQLVRAIAEGLAIADARIVS